MVGGTPRSIRTDTLFPCTTLLRSLAPSIAAVNGPAAGAGFSLALSCDFLIASDTAQFASAYAAAGLSADGGQSWTLPRRIGSHRARQMILQGRRGPASEALHWGIAGQVVSPDQMTGAATQVAENQARGTQAGYGRERKSGG